MILLHFPPKGQEYNEFGALSLQKAKSTMNELPCLPKMQSVKHWPRTQSTHGTPGTHGLTDSRTHGLTDSRTGGRA